MLPRSVWNAVNNPVKKYFHQPLLKKYICVHFWPSYNIPYMKKDGLHYIYKPIKIIKYITWDEQLLTFHSGKNAVTAWYLVVEGGDVSALRNIVANGGGLRLCQLPLNLIKKIHFLRRFKLRTLCFNQQRHFNTYKRREIHSGAVSYNWLVPYYNCIYYL